MVVLVPIVALGVFLYKRFASQPYDVPRQIVNPVQYDEVKEELTEVEYSVEEYARNLEVPWSIVFTSGSRMLVTERPGRIREITNGQINPNSLITFSDTANSDEEGLMGIILDPGYSRNKFLYVCYAYRDSGKIRDRVIRLVDNGDSLVQNLVLIEGIPAAKFHAGCALRFGPDGKLYVTTGDATSKQIAQDLNSLSGKILRMNSDGTIPRDNPFSDSYIYSLGHRNPQGIDFHPVSGLLYESEHGPSGFDGPPGGDEVNIIIPGENYGWPEVSHEESDPAYVDPELVFTPAFAPGSGTFYSSSVIPQFKNNFLLGGLRGEGIIRVITNTEGTDVVAFERIPEVQFGRIRAITQGPDGYVYFSTSNRDGRGDLYEGDDKIFRIRPVID